MATADKDRSGARQIEEVLADVREAFRPLVDAMKRLAAVFKNLNATAARWDAELLYGRRAAYGGNARDAELHPDEWQSIACSTWLPDCPSDEYDLRCTGRRHQR